MPPLKLCTGGCQVMWLFLKSSEDVVHVQSSRGFGLVIRLTQLIRPTSGGLRPADKCISFRTLVGSHASLRRAAGVSEISRDGGKKRSGVLHLGDRRPDARDGRLRLVARGRI